MKTTYPSAIPATGTDERRIREEQMIRRKFRAQTMHNTKDVKLTLIGGWIDLAGYYAGSDGNAYSLQDSYVNMGALDDFKARWNADAKPGLKLRGILFS